MNTQRTILIYRHNGAGKMYLCADGSLSSNPAHAAHYWEGQFQATIAEQWLCTHGGVAGYDYYTPKTVVDRSKWHRGRGGDESALLTRWGTMCCLGFRADQHGYEAPYGLMGHGTPACTYERGTAFVNSHGDNTELCNAAMEVNDDTAITDDVREARLKELFARAGEEIEFVDSVRLTAAQHNAFPGGRFHAVEGV